MVLEKMTPRIADLARKWMMVPDYETKLRQYLACWDIMSQVPPSAYKAGERGIVPCAVCKHTDECWELLEIEVEIERLADQKVLEVKSCSANDVTGKPA